MRPGCVQVLLVRTKVHMNSRSKSHRDPWGQGTESLDVPFLDWVRMQSGPRLAGKNSTWKGKAKPSGTGAEDRDGLGYRGGTDTDTGYTVWSFKRSY